MSQSSGAWRVVGSGMEKKFFHDGRSEYGWLNFMDPGVMERELAARQALMGLNELLPQIDRVREPPTLDGVKSPTGYYVKRIALERTIKPKMCALAIPIQVNNVLKSLDTVQKKEAAINSLTTIKNSIALISNQVGELTIAFDNVTGKGYLLDLAKDANGQAGGPVLAQSAGTGLQKLIDRLIEQKAALEQKAAPQKRI